MDNLNEYYDVNLKKARLARLQSAQSFTFEKQNIEDGRKINEMFKSFKPDVVAHLAAQAGVRYSLENPSAYIDSNLSGFFSILDASKNFGVQHLVYASTSSVYGLNTKLPFSTHDGASHPASLYAATKRANELLAHSYSHMFGLPTTGLRFFTVYGPWGRPDMALFLFTKNILEGKPIDVFNRGDHLRDFTYIDDIVDGVTRVLEGSPQKGDAGFQPSKPDPATSSAPYRLYNIGNNKPEKLSRYIEVLEKALGKTAKKNYLPFQIGDIAATHADVTDLSKDYGYQPSTSIDVGIEKFVRWYREYYKA